MEGLLRQQGFAVVDGGLATELERRGADLRDPLWSARMLLPEENVHDQGAELIKAVHRAYLEAGADIIVTSSYQASVAGLRKRGLSEEDAARVVRRSLQLAHAARQEFWSDEAKRRHRLYPLVAASIGPYGAYLADGSEYRGQYGASMSEEELIDFHRPRIELLLADPALAPDLFACETLPCLVEAQALVKLFETSYPKQRIWLTFTCRDHEHISDGHRFSEVVSQVISSDVVLGVGINCTGPQYITQLLESARVPGQSKPFIVYPNSGEGWDSAAHQWTAPVDSAGTLADLSAVWFGLGARIIGGCCRTTPDDITAVRAALYKAHQRHAEKKTADQVDLASALHRLECGDGLGLSESVEVGRTEGRGRLVRARAAGVKAGEAVATAEVFVWAHLPREARRLCAHCGRHISEGIRCRGGCSSVYYCQVSCAEEGEVYHGGAGCRSMRRYEAGVATGLRKGTLPSSLFGSQEASMLARLVIGVLTHPDRQRRALTLALEANQEAISPTRLSQYAQIAEVVVASLSLPRGEKKIAREDIVRLLCIQQCNSFGLSNEEGEMTGVAIYPELSLFNHSCLPNCASVEDPAGDKRRCVIKAIIPAAPGEELTISYIDLDMSRELRLQKLEESYAFLCSCPRCARPPAGDPNEEDSGTKAYLSWITCSTCGGTLIPTPPGQEELVACNSCTFTGKRLTPSPEEQAAAPPCS